MNSRTYLYTVLFICRLTEYAKILFSEVAPLMWYIIHLYVLMHYVGIYFLNISSSTAFLHIYLCKMIQVSFVYFSVLFILPQSCLLFLLFMSVYVSQRSCSGNLFLTAHRSLFKRGSVQFSSVPQSCLTLCDSMNRSTPGLPVHHQLPELTQTHVHRVGDAIQPFHPLSSPSPPAPNPSQHQGLFQWVNSSHQLAKVLEFQLQHQSFQWTPRTDLL